MDFDIRLAFTCTVGPPSVVYIELGQARPFPPKRVFKVQWLWALNLVCEVTLTCWGGIQHWELVQVILPFEI